MKLPPILRNRKAQLGLAGAGVVGMVAFLRHRGAGAAASPSGSTSPTASTATTGGAGLGTYDSTSTDVARQLSDYSQGVQGQLADFRNEFNTTLSGLTAGTTKAPTTTPVTATPAKTTTPPKVTTKAVPAGYGWFNTAGKTYTVASLAQRYGLSSAQVITLNPTLKGKSKVGANTLVKVRSNASAIKKK